MDKQLLEILACPACQGALALENTPHGLHCPACALLYPVVDGIPLLLKEEAVPLEKGQGQHTTANTPD
jgi:Uncharacterized conserved protein